MKYFVVFQAEWDGYRNDVITFPKEIACYEDIEELEMLIKKVWYGDDRELTLINFKKLA